MLRTNLRGLPQILTLLLLSCCSGDRNTEKYLFKRLLPSETGIDFQNNIKEGPNTNVLMYEYFYNGGGVAVADFNGDQKLDVYASSNMESNKLYLNKGALRFQDVTRVANVAGRNGPWKTGVTAVDINGDQRMDIYVCYSGSVKQRSRENQLFLNMGNNSDGTPIFNEVGKMYGLNIPAYSNQGYFFDYDRDGDLDMLLLNHNPKSLPILNKIRSKELLKEDSPLIGLRLFEQKDRFFNDITQKSGINGSALSYGLGIALSDFNNDGWIDFYVCNDYDVPDYLYINDTKGGFTDQLRNSITHTSKFSMGNDTGDIDNDGHIDLITLDMLPEDNKRQKLLRAPDNYNLFDLNLKNGFHYQFMRNMVQKNNGNGTFSEIGQMLGVSNTDWSWSALFGDYDNDGWCDLFVTNGYHRDYTNKDFLNYMDDFVNQKKGTLSRADVLEIIEKMPSSNISNYIYRNINGKIFDDKTADWGLHSTFNSNGAGYGDLDNDGDLDLVVSNINDPLGIYENRTNDNVSFLKIKLIGKGLNINALGARVEIFHDGKMQTKEQFATRGYLSSVSHILHFGLGRSKKIDSLVVRWPDNTILKKNNIEPDQTIELYQNQAIENTTKKKKNNPLFEKIHSPFKFSHITGDILDFNRQKLLHLQPSFSGPPMASGDINNDGLNELVIGGGINQPTSIIHQYSKGKFKTIDSEVIEKDKFGVDTFLNLIDIDNDRDLDLYVGRGGYHNFKNNSEELCDAIYLNEGNFNFKKYQNLPAINEVTSATAFDDLNNDGMPDIFLGGGIVPGQYPKRYDNKILLSKKNGSYSLNESLSRSVNFLEGIVRDAEWIDLDNDKVKDLILVGEWMPVSVFLRKNNNLIYQENFFNSQLTERGWWNCIISKDLNKDGIIDFVMGNEGINTQYNVSITHPITIHFDDFDANGSIDPIISYYIKDQSYPMASRDELLSQWVALKSEYPNYASFSEVTTDQLLKDHLSSDTAQWEAKQMKSIVIMSSPNGYNLDYLPDKAQISPILDGIAEDFNADGHLDLLLVGNRSKIALKLGKHDGNYGTVLLGNGTGNFTYLPFSKAGLKLNKDIRNIAKINDYYFFSTIQDSVMTYKFSSDAYKY